MTTHYQTLGLGEQASADDIRRAYRRLVLLTHPDRTPDPAAHARYLAINAAYDVLGQARRRAGYDALLWAQRHPPASPPAASPAPSQPAPAARPAGRGGPQPDRYAADYARYSPYARWVCRVVLAFCALLLLDLCCTTSSDEPILALDGFVVPSPELSRAVGTHAIALADVDFHYYNEYGDSLFVGQKLRVRRTPLFGVVRSVGYPTELLLPSLHEPPTIYSTFVFIPLLMAAVAALGALPESPPKRRVDAAICLGLLVPICLFVLFHR